ncbi:unnamed protein product [Lampetra planeri]
MGRHARGAPTFASEGEDRAIRLGVVLVLFAFASFSTLALCWMRPALQLRARTREDNCSVTRVDAGDGGASGPAGEPCAFSCGPACRGDSRYPCVRVFARLAHSSGRVALLHQDLLQLSLNPRVRAGGQVLLRAAFVPPGPLRERAQRERLGGALAAQSGALRFLPLLLRRAAQARRCHPGSRRQPGGRVPLRFLAVSHPARRPAPHRPGHVRKEPVRARRGHAQAQEVAVTATKRAVATTPRLMRVLTAVAGP